MIQYVSCVPFCSTWMNTCAYTALCPNVPLVALKWHFFEKNESDYITSLEFRGRSRTTCATFTQYPFMQMGLDIY